VAETETVIYMLEPKMSSQMTDAEVLAKKEVAVRWCQQATDYMQQHGGKPWIYVLIPHDAIAENITLKGLIKLFGN
jgi:type III restriction enzyme